MSYISYINDWRDAFRMTVVYQSDSEWVIIDVTETLIKIAACYS